MEDPNFQSGVIYVVDDEQLIAMTVATILNKVGHQASSYNRGQHLLDAALLKRPDIVVSDVMMPGMSGIELAGSLARFDPTIQVILFSGQAETSELIEQARRRGETWNVRAKPFHPEDLLQDIQTLLKR